MQMSNDAPNITSSEVTSVNEDTDYSYTFTASDVDSGDTVTLAAPTKPSWLSFNTGTGVLSGTPTNRNVGDHSLVLSATDVAGAVTTQNFIITVNNVNDAPTVNNAISDQATAENSAFSYQFASDVFADVDIGDSLTNTATLSDGSALPSWLKFDADTRTFSGTPLNVNVGDIAVKVTATDSSSVTGSDTFNITVTNINDAPNITSSEVTSVNEDTDYSYTFTASDVDSGDTVTLAAPTKPSWLSFNAGTGVLSGMPTNSNIGDHSIVLSATDVVGAVTTQNFTITVTATLETNGDYDLAHDGDNYYIIDGNDNKLGLTFLGKPVGPNKWDGWSATQVEESASGGYEVLWSHNGGRTWVWKTDASGAYVSGITGRTVVENETIFKADLDLDGYTGTPPPTTLETNGNYELAHGSDKYYIIDDNDNRLELNYLGNPVGPNKWDGWSATQVEESLSGGYEVLWSHNNGNTWVWKVDVSGNYESAITGRFIAENETIFEVDLDGDTHIGIPPTTTLETNGDYELANGSDNYYIIDDNDNKLGLTYYGKPLGPNKWDGWSATQVEESASGGFEVLWSHNNGNTWVFKVNALGNYESAITGRTVAENETIFEVDLDGDTHIGIPPTTTLETNGDYELAHGGNKYYIEVTGSDVIYLEETGNFKLGKQGDQHYILDSDGNGIRFDMPKYAPGYFYTDTPLHVEEGLDYVGFQNDFPDGNFWVLFQRQEWASKGGGYNKGYMARKYDESGNYNGSDIVKTGNYVHLRHYMEYEAMFGVDLNKDGKIATGINPNNLMDISGNKHHEDDATKSVSISLKYSGNPVGPNKWDGWSATQVEESASGGFEVLWSHSGGRTWVWKTDASGNYVSTIDRTIAENETIFEVDLDGDGVIGLNFKMVDITGDYKLAKAANQYHIIKANDATADIISFGNTGTNGVWRVKQVEASASGGYELFHVHDDGRTMVHKVDAAGNYQNHIYRSIAQNETIFLVDLNGDGYTNIETNGDYTLALHGASQKYYILDGNGVSIGLTNIHGSPVGPGSFSEKDSIWKAVQVEESVAGFEVLWSDVGTAAMPDIQWKTDATGKFQKFIYNSFSDYLELRETIFEADLNGDGLITIETNGNFKIIGSHGNDTIDGDAGNDTLDGGTGKDIITTGSGSDTIYLRIGDGGNALSDADIITDFTDGSDNFGLTNGLSFGDLTRTQGSGDYANDTIIKYGSEYLTILQNIDFGLLTEADFVDVDIA